MPSRLVASMQTAPQLIRATKVSTSGNRTSVADPNSMIAARSSMTMTLM
jgi:hypothetical protein